MASSNLGVSSGESYRNEFDPQAYLHYYYDNLTEVHAELLKLLHEFYRSYGSKSSGLKVLDYGAGPTVLYAISAALQASEIVLADYSEKNCEALQGWLKRDPEAHDWTPFFKYVVQSLEGLGEEEVTKRQEDVRTLIKAVVKCDVHMDPPIQSGYEGPYDVIISLLCLECACSSLEEYEDAMTKLSTLLKPGGRIVLSCVEGEDSAPTQFYMVGAHKFVSLTVTESFMRSTLEKAGFYNISLKRQLRDTTGVNVSQEASDNYYAMLFITATKK